MTTIIIGAGASGLACAIKLKQNNSDNEVIVLERLSTAGKKILATGNGRCNLSNSSAAGCEKVLDFFSSLGLVTRTDEEGRIYPYSNQAVTVLDILLESCEKLGVEIITDCTVEAVDKDLTITTSQGIFMADNVVIACGGMAQEKLGSDGSGFKILKSLGHKITTLSPALVQLTSPSKYPRQLKGHRVKCNMSILLDNEVADSEYGEVLFADYGLSGIVTMNLSHIAGENFISDKPKKCHAVLDLIPEMNTDELIKYINKYKSLKGILGTRLSAILEKQADGNADKMAEFAKNWKLIINGTKGFAFAQITNGGVKADELTDYQSNLMDNIYICGEIIEGNLPCGGYNLNQAWLSGITAADNIGEKYDKN